MAAYQKDDPALGPGKSHVEEAPFFTIGEGIVPGNEEGKVREILDGIWKAEPGPVGVEDDGPLPFQSLGTVDGQEIQAELRESPVVEEGFPALPHEAETVFV